MVYSPPRAFLIFLSTPSVRRATVIDFQKYFCKSISIHALREEGDLGVVLHNVQTLRFLSTPSVRRATRINIFLETRY